MENLDETHIAIADEYIEKEQKPWIFRQIIPIPNATTG